MASATRDECASRPSTVVAPTPSGMGYELHVAYKADARSLSELLRASVPPDAELLGHGGWQGRVLETLLWGFGAWAFCAFIAQFVSLFVLGYSAAWSSVGWALAFALVLANWVAPLRFARGAARVTQDR